MRSIKAQQWWDCTTEMMMKALDQFVRYTDSTVTHLACIQHKGMRGLRAGVRHLNGEHSAAAHQTPHQGGEEGLVVGDPVQRRVAVDHIISFRCIFCNSIDTYVDIDICNYIC